MIRSNGSIEESSRRPATRVRKKMKAKAMAARMTMSISGEPLLRPDPLGAGQRRDGLVAVEEFAPQGSRADGGRVDLVVHVEDVLVARRDMPELEHQRAVAAPLAAGGRRHSADHAAVCSDVS